MIKVFIKLLIKMVRNSIKNKNIKIINNDFDLNFKKFYIKNLLIYFF